MKFKLVFIIVIIVNLLTSCSIMRMPCDLVDINTNDSPKPYLNNYNNYLLSVPTHYVPAYIVGPEDDVVYSYVYRYKKKMCINIGTIPLNSENFEEQHYNEHNYNDNIEPLIFQGNNNGLYWKTAVVFKYVDDSYIPFYIEYANIPIQYLSLFEESLTRTIAYQKTK